MTDDPRRGADAPRDPWGNPLPPDDSTSDTPRDPWGNPVPPEHRPPNAPNAPGSAEHPPFPSGPGEPPRPAPSDVNPAWPPSASSAPPPYGQAPPPPYGQPSPYGGGPEQPGPPAQGYGQPPAWMPRRNEGMAVGALVCALVGIVVCGVVLEPIAIGLGVAARRRIRQSNGQLKGDGLAIAAIVIGVIAFVISIVALVVVARNPDILDNLLETSTSTTAGSSG